MPDTAGHTVINKNMFSHNFQACGTGKLKNKCQEGEHGELTRGFPLHAAVTQN